MVSLTRLNHQNKFGLVQLIYTNNETKLEDYEQEILRLRIEIAPFNANLKILIASQRMNHSNKHRFLKLF